MSRPNSFAKNNAENAENAKKNQKLIDSFRQSKAQSFMEWLKNRHHFEKEKVRQFAQQVQKSSPPFAPKQVEYFEREILPLLNYDNLIAE